MKLFKIRKRGKQVLSNLLLTFIPILFQAVFSFFIIRQSSATLWGEFVQMLIWINLIILLLNFGSRDYLIRDFSQNPGQYKNIWSRALAERLLLFLFSVPFLFLFNDTFIIIIWVFFLFINRSFDVLFIFKNRFHLQFYRDVFIYTLSLITFIEIDEINLTSILIFLTVISVLQSAFNLVYFKITENVKMQFRPDKHLIHLKNAFPFFLVALSGMLQSRSEIYMVSILADANTLATYQVFANFLTLWLTAVYMILLPFQKQLYRMPEKTIVKFQRNFSIFSITVTMFYFIALSHVLDIFYSFQYSVYFWLLAFFSQIPIILSYITVQKLYRIAAERHLVKISFMLTFFEIALNYIFIPFYALEGVITIKALMSTCLLLIYRKTAKKLAPAHKELLT